MRNFFSQDNLHINVNDHFHFHNEESTSIYFFKLHIHIVNYMQKYMHFVCLHFIVGNLQVAFISLMKWYQNKVVKTQVIVKFIFHFHILHFIRIQIQYIFIYIYNIIPWNHLIKYVWIKKSCTTSKQQEFNVWNVQ